VEEVTGYLYYLEILGISLTMVHPNVGVGSPKALLDIRGKKREIFF
jgi:hypothetical protein